MNKPQYMVRWRPRPGRGVYSPAATYVAEGTPIFDTIEEATAHAVSQATQFPDRDWFVVQVLKKVTVKKVVTTTNQTTIIDYPTRA